MQNQNTSLRELTGRYEDALRKSGMSYSSQLEWLNRMRPLVLRHEDKDLEYIDREIVADYFCNIDERCYTGKISKGLSQKLNRSAQRFLHFVETGEINLPNPLKGSRYSLSPEFEKISAAYLSTNMHPNTRNDARWVINKYFLWLDEKGCENLSDAGGDELQKYLLFCSRTYSQSTMYDIKLHLNKLYSYLFSVGLFESSYQALLKFPVNRETKIFPPLPKDEIAEMLAAINRKTVSGKRAYAAMMLGAVVGLRACDAAALKLTDIDWVRGEIRILQSKTRKTATLPLTKDVGEALQSYILEARPMTDAPQIFLRIKAPFTPIASAVTVGEMFRDACKAAGLDYGKRFHMLRRTLGTSMINRGVTVETAAQVLGDTQIDSLKPYVAVDVKHLKMCALPFDEIVPIVGGAAL